MEEETIPSSDPSHRNSFLATGGAKYVQLLLHYLLVASQHVGVGLMGAQRTSHEKCASFQDQSHTPIRSLYPRERAVVPLVRPQMTSFEDREGPCEFYVQSPRTVPAAENDSPIQIILTETAIYATSSYILSSRTRGLVFTRLATYLKVKNTWNAKVVAKRWSPNRSFKCSLPSQIYFRALLLHPGNRNVWISHFITPRMHCERLGIGTMERSRLLRAQEHRDQLGAHPSSVQGFGPSYWLSTSLRTRPPSSLPQKGPLRR